MFVHYSNDFSVLCPFASGKPSYCHLKSRELSEWLNHQAIKLIVLCSTGWTAFTTHYRDPFMLVSFVLFMFLKENPRSSSFIRVFLSLRLPRLCFKYVSDQRSSRNSRLTFWQKNHVFPFRPWWARSFCCSSDFWPPQIDTKFAQDHYKKNTKSSYCLKLKPS